MRVLLLCASHNDLGLMLALKKMGMYIIVTGSIPNLPAQQYADEYIQADYSDKELILKIAKEKNIHAICQCCNDFGVYTAAYVAEQLDLPGYDSYKTTLLLHNKDKFKQFAEEHRISTPKSFVFTDHEEALKWSQSASYPLIVKPSDASAGNGSEKIESLGEVEGAILQAFQQSRNHVILIEEYVEGTQHGFCTFLRNQKVVAHCTNNEYSIMNPYRVEIDTFPASNYKQVEELLIREIEKIAEILQLRDGIFHLQYIMKEGKPYIIEVMRRVLGNMYSVPANMLTNMDWDYWEARVRCGLSSENFPKQIEQQGYYAYKTILAPSNGNITRIEIPKQYKDYIVREYYLKKVGDAITNYKSQPIGFLFLIFRSEEEMFRILIESYDNAAVAVQSFEVKRIGGDDE